jgi:hypothetical protein
MMVFLQKCDKKCFFDQKSGSAQKALARFFEI